MKIELSPNYIIKIIDKDEVEISDASYNSLLQITDKDRTGILAEILKFLSENTSVEAEILQKKFNLNYNEVMELINILNKFGIVRIIGDTQANEVIRYFINDESYGKIIEHLYSFFFKGKLIEVKNLEDSEIAILIGYVPNYDNIIYFLEKNRKYLKDKYIYYYLYDGSKINVISSIFGVTACLYDLISFLSLNIGEKMEFKSMNLLVVKRQNIKLSDKDLIALSFLAADLYSLKNYGFSKLFGKLIQVDDFSISQIKLIRNPYCKICGVSPHIYSLSGDEV
ncbi:MAG: hypothetical protein QXR34_09420 [Saccharolobus sp.]|uniref:hypothetical protein n=1 Tax=Thermoprotei TaxID=183924 RepID=UPI00315F34E0